jgi:ferrochelatase
MSKISKNKKVAIVFFNLGGPDSLNAVKPFLFNLFNDKYIITLPKIFRSIIAWIISSRREKIAREIYSQMGNKSTILEETQNQAKAVKEYLNDKVKFDYEIFTCMRHWHPMSLEVIKKIENYAPDELILLPLYPHFSTTTTGSSIEDFISEKEKTSLKNTKCKTICCYPTDSNFIRSHVDLIMNMTKELDRNKNYRILFSAHGLPKRVIKSGDPYQWQIESTVKHIIKNIPLQRIDYRITYQSKVGPLEWIGPNTEDEIELAAKQGLDLIIVPIAFVSEHSETKVELDIEYREIAEKYKISYKRVPTLSINKFFIKSLGEIIIKTTEKEEEFVASSEFTKICPDSFGKCPCKIRN